MKIEKIAAITNVLLLSLVLPWCFGFTGLARTISKSFDDYFGKKDKDRYSTLNRYRKGAEIFSGIILMLLSNLDPLPLLTFFVIVQYIFEWIVLKYSIETRKTGADIFYYINFGLCCSSINSLVRLSSLNCFGFLEEKKKGKKKSSSEKEKRKESVTIKIFKSILGIKPGCDNSVVSAIYICITWVQKLHILFFSYKIPKMASDDGKDFGEIYKVFFPFEAIAPIVCVIVLITSYLFLRKKGEDKKKQDKSTFEEKFIEIKKKSLEAPYFILTSIVCSYCAFHVNAYTSWNITTTIGKEYISGILTINGIIYLLFTPAFSVIVFSLKTINVFRILVLNCAIGFLLNLSIFLIKKGSYGNEKVLAYVDNIGNNIIANNFNTLFYPLMNRLFKGKNLGFGYFLFKLIDSVHATILLKVLEYTFGDDKMKYNMNPILIFGYGLSMIIWVIDLVVNRDLGRYSHSFGDCS